MRTTTLGKLCAIPACWLLLGSAQIGVANAATQAAGQTPAKPVEHILGTITAVDSGAHTITVKDDKSSAESVISTANTRTLIKVLPGAKDLKGATRITADDLAIGDRVDVRGFKDDANPNLIAARSVVLMSARELQEKHQADTAAWQNSTSGLVTAVDLAGRTLTITSRSSGGPKPITIQIPPSAELTRYSPESPATPVSSQMSDIQTGDQVRIIGAPSGDGASITAQRIYSGAFRTIPGTVLSIGPDGKSLAIRNLQTKQSTQIALTDTSTVHKLPPEMAAIAARRLNGSQAGASGPQPGAGASPEGQAPNNAEARPRPRGDFSQMLQHLPTIALSDLKPGDAVIVSGVFNNDKSKVIASNIIAGVEPILQSPAGRSREGQGLGDWSLDMAMPNQ